MAFAIDVRWARGEDPSASAVTRFNSAFRPADEYVCAWVPEEEPATVRIEFDVDAADYDSATRRAIREVESAASKSGLPGEVVEVVAMTEDGQVRWVR
jgi:hypothetical protein